MAENRLCHFGKRCTRGDKCKFKHLNDEGSPSTQAKSKQICRHGDKCRNIQTCLYGHSSSTPSFKSNEDPSIRSNDSSIPSSATANSRVVSKCRYKDQCRNKTCEFDHTPSTTMLADIIQEIDNQLKSNVPKILEEHETRMEFLKSQLNNDDDLESNMALKTFEEHRLQWKTFRSTIRSHTNAPVSTDDQAAKHRLNAIKREIKRLKSHLPIYARRQELLDVIQSNRVIILKADTGSGKSTQLVQYLVDGGLTEKGEIVCTEPRRLAARTLASRVAEEFGCNVGEEVGFRVGAVRPRVSESTKIRFVTDSILLNEYVEDAQLSRYSIVIIDEAHERRVDTDLLFGIMKLCLQKRTDLKLIVMSATLDTELLRNYYANSVVVEVPGRTYPIEDEYAIDDVENYVEASIAKTIEIHKSEEPGDILIFLTGPDEIDRAVADIQGKYKDTAIVLPLHGKLTEDETKRVFDPAPAGKRKIIFSTNVAETSVTIDGIRHVVETGMVKESMWDEKRHMQVLKIGTITQSSVKQRRGRAGRTCAGKPSIAVLKLKYLGVVDDVEQFDWLESPSIESIRDAIRTLQWLNAIDRQTNQITEIGRSMAKFGLPPMLSAMILKSIELDCEGPIIALAGMLSVSQNIWWRSKDVELREKAEEKRIYFAHENDQGGDHIQLLKIFLEWTSKQRGQERSTWCVENMINGKAMNIAFEFVNEMYRQMGKIVIGFESIQLNDELIEKILICITAGYFQNLALSNGTLKAGYRLISAENLNAQVYRSSTITLAKEPPKYVIYHEILNLNGTNCLTNLCPINYEWLPKDWLNSLARQPKDLIFVGHVFPNIGPGLMSACLGKRCAKKQQLEDLLDSILDVNYEESTLTVWCEQKKLNRAKSHLEKLINNQRDKFIQEVEEYDIVGDTRVVLGEGGLPILVLTADEYIKVIVKNLPPNVTEENIQKLFETPGQGSSISVRCVNITQASSTSLTASVIYYRYIDAQNAVARLTNYLWSGHRLTVNTGSDHTTDQTNSQQCKLEVRGFLTESEGNGKITFTDKNCAEKASILIEQSYGCQCRLHTNSIHTMVRCFYPIQNHKGQAFLDFSSHEEANSYIRLKQIETMLIQSSKKKSTSIYVQNIPMNYDEDDVKARFPNAKSIFLLYPRKINQMEFAEETKENVRRLFENSRSFLSDSLTIRESKSDGRIEVQMEFQDEDETKALIQEMNGKTDYSPIGKLHLSLMNFTQNKKVVQTQNEYVVKLSKLSLNIIEEDIIGLLKNHQLIDHLKFIRILRKKSEENQLNANTDQNYLEYFRNLFYSSADFRSEPQIHIRPVTDDGRLTAFVTYNNPDDVQTAMRLSQDPQRQHQYHLNQSRLYLTPRHDHMIELNRFLVEAIPDKIDQSIEEVKQKNLFNVKIFKKEMNKNNKKSTRIHIQSTDAAEMAEARVVFDRLMKGLEFRFHHSSWVSVIFTTEGKKFLEKLQEETKTYIWWNWSSTFLRIFGNNQMSNLAYRRIDEYIQEQLQSQKLTVHLVIPQVCVRQCLKNIDKIKEYGDEKTSVDVNLMKKSIRISGDEDHVKQCQDRLKEYFSAFQQESTSAANSSLLCQFCCDTCQSPHTLQQCGCTFCRDCLYQFFQTRFNPTLNLKDFQLSCPIHNKSCLIRDIKSVLGAENILKLAKAAFQIYIKQTDNDLAQCIGIDCLQVYRPSKNPLKYACDQCLKEYCIRCQIEYHEGITCEAHQRLMNKDHEKELWKENLGSLPYKKCPQCDVLIEKYAGCNAVICTQCRIAFCWLCSKTDPRDAHPHFNDRSTACYGKTFT